MFNGLKKKECLFFQEKIKSQLAETDAVKRELKSSKTKLEEEQKTRIRIEQQLDQHNEKVKNAASFC
jgi:hypothetical protein